MLNYYFSSPVLRFYFYLFHNLLQDTYIKKQIQIKIVETNSIYINYIIDDKNTLFRCDELDKY